MARACLLLIVLAGCTRSFKPLQASVTFATPVTPAVSFPAAVVAGATGLTADIIAPIDGLHYDWTLFGATIKSASRATDIAFDAGGVGTILYSVTVSNDRGDTATPASGSAQVLAPLPANYAPIIIAPARVLVGIGGVNAAVAAPLAGVSYAWQVSGAGIIDSPTSAGAAVTFAATGSGNVDLSVTASVAGADGGSATAVAHVLAAQASGTLSIVAGQAGGRGYLDGSAADARLGALLPSQPLVGLQGGGGGVFTAADANGTLYWTDSLAHTIRKLQGGVVSTVAGAPFEPGLVDATGSAARFSQPSGIAVAPVDVGTLLSAGDLLVADTANCGLRRVTPAGAVTTLNAAGASIDPSMHCGTGTTGVLSSANYAPTYVAIDGGGYLYVSNVTMVRAYDSSGAYFDTLDPVAGPCPVNGVASGLAVDSMSPSTLLLSFGPGPLVYAPGMALASFTTICKPLPIRPGIAAIGGRLLAFANVEPRLTITDSGARTTAVAGSVSAGAMDGAGVAASFDPFDALGANIPSQVIASVPGTTTLLVADWQNGLVRRVDNADSSADVHTVAGSPSAAGDSLVGLGRFRRPTAIAVDAGDTLLVADSGNGKLKRVTPAGVITTLAGNGSSAVHDGPVPFGSVRNVSAMTLLDNGDLVFGDALVIDQLGQTTVSVVRRFDAATGALTTVAGGASDIGHIDGPFGVAFVFEPHAFVARVDGSFLFTDASRAGLIEFGGLRQLLPNGEVTTLLGGNPTGTDNAGVASTFIEPWGLASDGASTLYVSDASAGQVRRVVLGATDVTVDTIAGLIPNRPTMPGSSVDGPCATARFVRPQSLVREPTGDLLLIDDRTLRRITAPGADACAVTTLAGNENDASIAVLPGVLPASLNQPGHLARALGGSLFLVDQRENVVLRVEPKN